MIAKAKAISHGINDIRYITGKSHNKNIRKKSINLSDIGQYDAIEQDAMASGIPCSLLFPASVR